MASKPASARTGQPITLTASFANADNPNCGVRVHWGDGQTKDYKINQPKDAPLVVQHSYAKAGSYTVMVEPKSLGMSLRCLGDAQRVAVNVVAPPPVVAVGVPVGVLSALHQNTWRDTAIMTLMLALFCRFRSSRIRASSTFST